MNEIMRKIKVSNDIIKETSWFTIIFFSLLYSVYVTLINLVVIKSNFLYPIAKATSGLISQTLLINMFSIVIFIDLVVLKYGKLSLFDIGIKKNRLVRSTIIIILIWFAMQLLNFFVGIIISGSPIIHENWIEYSILNIFGSFIGQLFGNCLFEEIAFRGFLLVQICKKFNATIGNLFIGLVISQVMFSLIHIPNRILSGMTMTEILLSLMIVFVLGILFSVIYLVTDNLFLAIGIHALWNMPLLVFNGLPSTVIILIITSILLVFWNRIFGEINISESNI